MTLSVLSTTPQDEEYARQLQFELDMMSNMQDRDKEKTGPLQGDRVTDRVSVIMECGCECDDDITEYSVYPSVCPSVLV